MPEKLDLPIKHCECCGRELNLRNQRDITRKRFCSRRCFALKILPHKGCRHSVATKNLISERAREGYKNGRVNMGWAYHEITPRISGIGYWFKGHTRLHRHIMELQVGRPLTPDEVVHHIDNNKLNNALDNLQIMIRSEHTKLHLGGRIKCLRQN